MVRRVKPLCRLTERETAAYCLVRGIDYIQEQCLFSAGASLFKLKGVLNELEKILPEPGMGSHKGPQGEIFVI